MATLPLRRHHAAALAGVFVMPGLALLLRLQPRWLARLLARHSGHVVFAVDTRERVVGLTFDDGPHSDVTPPILEVLARYDAHATFFFMGSSVEGNEELLTQVHRAGHEIGNHFWTDFPSVLLSDDDLTDQLRRTEHALLLAGAEPPDFMRPASGWFRPSMLRMARDHGYRIALGSIAVLDAESRNPERELAFTLKRLQPGAIIVLHEGRASRHRVVELTELLLSELTERGFRSVTLSELVKAPSSS